MAMLFFCIRHFLPNATPLIRAWSRVRIVLKGDWRECVGYPSPISMFNARLLHFVNFVKPYNVIISQYKYTHSYNSDLSFRIFGQYFYSKIIVDKL